MNSDIRERSRLALRDPQLQGNLRHALGHTLDRRRALVRENPRWPLLRQQASRIRDAGLNRHVELREMVTERIEARGGTVHLCADAAAARALVVQLLGDAGATLVVKGKSMVTEEIALNPALESAGVRVFEGDLGELIVQLRGEAPSHITAPALHLNRQQIAALFTEAFGTRLGDQPAELTAAARAFLRERFLTADAGITGANFVIAETGSVVLVENEANIRLATTLPRLHIAVTGIEKLVPRLTDLPPLLELLPTSGTGQKMTGAVSILGGARAPGEVDGPAAFHLVLVDNGRSRLRADPLLRKALRCIRCGACLNVCPVFQRIGGHGFGSVYPGPIGVLLSRELLGLRDSAHAFACSLCGACDEHCPVEIPLSELILEVRRRCQREAGVTGELLAHHAFAAAAQRPPLFRAAMGAARGLSRLWPTWLSSSLTGVWTDGRAFPIARGRTLRQRLAARRQGGGRR